MGHRRVHDVFVERGGAGPGGEAAGAEGLPRVEESVLVGGSLADAWDVYFDLRGWAAWVDGFGAVVDASPDYPQAGSALSWRSVPAGRGEVRERVLEHERRRRHVVALEDPAMTGTLETTFAIEGEGTRVRQSLDYRLRDRGPIARIAALLFVKGQLRASLRRTLGAFRREVEERAARPL